jgi:uncharacterized protein (TIGR02996 family)
MSHDAFVKAIRTNPDDDTARLVFADWYEEHGQPQRAEYIRASCRLARMPLSDPNYPTVQRRCLDLYAAHHADWVGNWPKELEWSFDRGLVTGVTGQPAALAKHWNDLFARHPIHRVRLADTVSVSRARAPKALGWLPLVDDLRVYWQKPSHQLFGHFDPARLRFRRLWIDGDPDPAQTLRALGGPTREVLESFRYINCRHVSEEERWTAQLDGFHRALELLDGAPLRELGLLPGGLSLEPEDLRKILARTFAPRLEYLELSAAEPTKGAADLIAATDRLPALKRLAHGIDDDTRLHSLGPILNSPRLPNLTSLATEWSSASDRTIRRSKFAARATEVQLWEPIRAYVPRTRVPLAGASIKPETLDVVIHADTDSPDGWLNAPWAAGLRALRLRDDPVHVLQFATRLARSAGFPALHTFSLIFDVLTLNSEMAKFVAAVRESEWLRNVLVTCHTYNLHAGRAKDDRLDGIVPAAAPENPGDLAWYATSPNVGRLRAFHILPAD